MDGIPIDTYTRIAREAVRYAVLSIPFTFNRMGIRSLDRKIINIAKGKLAEGLFFFFCEQNAVPINSKGGQTAFYQADLADFLFDGAEWDIKNNFLYHKGDTLQAKRYSWLPALIPDNRKGDQWDKGQKAKISAGRERRFLFTFLKGGEDPASGFQLLHLHLSSHQRRYLQQLYERYGGRRYPRPPFAEAGFWAEFFREDRSDALFVLTDFPPLIITGYARPIHRPLFQPTAKNQVWNGGLMRTVIQNQYVRISKLPAFATLLPRKLPLRYARFRQLHDRGTPFRREQ